MTKRVSLAERYAQTRAVQARRVNGLRRLDRATRERLAPVSADPAVRAYASVARTVAARMSVAIDTAIDAGLERPGALDALEQRLLRMTAPLARNARAAGKRIDAQARRELSRLLEVRLPPRDERDRVMLDLFVDQNLRYFRAMVIDQTAKLQEGIQAGETPALLRARDWVVRSRAPLIAKDQSWKLEGNLVQDWAQRAGEDEYDWLTCHDELVRAGHAKLDGRTFRYSDPPDTGNGRHNPGQDIHCRCRGVPRGAYRLAAQAR